MRGLVLSALFTVLTAGALAQSGSDERLRQAAALERAGNRDAARDAYRALVASAPRESGLRAAALSELSGIEIADGDHGAAIAHAQESAETFHRLGDERGRGAALNWAGAAYLSAGQYTEAASMFESAVTSFPSTDTSQGRAEAIGNLGNVFYLLGRYAEAARHYDSAGAAVDAQSEAEWAGRRRQILRVNQAILRQRLGQYHEALALYRQVGSESSLRPRERAQILTNLGALYRRLGDPIKALAAYDEAQALFLVDRSVDGELGVLTNRGIVQALEFGDLTAARRTFSGVLTVAKKEGNRFRELLARLYLAESHYRAGLDLAARAGFSRSLDDARALSKPEEEWKALFGLARVEQRAGAHEPAMQHLGQAIAVIESIREDIVTPALRTDFFEDKREVYDELISAQLPTARAAEVFALMDRSRARAWRERVGLSGRVSLEAVQARLRPTDVLLEFWHSAAGSAVVRLTETRAEVVPLRIDAKPLQAALDHLAGGPSADDAGASAALGAALLPSGLIPPGIEHVIVVPDGELAAVPFEWLKVGERRLIEIARVSYLPTAEAWAREGMGQGDGQEVRRGNLARSLSAWWPRMPWELQLRAFGDPRYETDRMGQPERAEPPDSAAPVGRPGRVGPAIEGRPRLAASAAEVRTVDDTVGGASLVFLGAEDQKARLLESASAPAPILHVATHGTADLTSPERSHLVFSPPAGSTEADYLFLREAYDLPLRGVELAVLSACETERGVVARGEGVQSFSRAFLAAGARSTITTLWRVPDGPTAEFMTVFYFHLQAGLDRAEALRRAKLAFLHSDTGLADPHFWAAFVLTGASGPVTRALRWPSLVAAAMSVVALSYLALHLRHRRVTRRALAPSPPAG